MLLRETPNMPQSSEWHFSKVSCENCAKYNKKTFKLENVAYVNMQE